MSENLMSLGLSLLIKSEELGLVEILQDNNPWEVNGGVSHLDPPILKLEIESSIITNK